MQVEAIGNGSRSRLRRSDRLAPRLAISTFLVSAILGSSPCPARGGPGGFAIQSALEDAVRLLGESKPDQALAALTPVEQVEPDNPWLWFYRGWAHDQLESPYRALECYDRAADILISLGDPDPDLTAQIRRRRHQARRQVLGVSFQLGLAYDSNVSYLGDAGTSDLVSGRGDGKFSSGFQIDFAPVADRGEVLAAGVRFGHSWHFAIEQFDYQDYGAYLRYAKTLGDGWEVSLRYDYDLTLLGNEPFVSQHSLTPALTHRPEPGPGSFQLLETSVYYRFDALDYLFDIEPAFDRDGLAHSVGIGQRYSWRPISDWPGWWWELSAGYRYESYFTEGTEFDRRVHNFDLGLAMPLVDPLRPDRYLLLPDKELLFRFDVNWQIVDYRNPSRFDRDRDERYDVITTYGFVLSQTLLSNPQDGDLVLHAIISWTDAHSNVTTREFLEPFTYDKVIYGLQLAWTW